ncbi:hypothetical protein G9P44_004681 [Scheffersomyces stipitis]|nr:hypothetical protein G9P44_004681 [Scheffersomyces stipitis]
MFSLEVALNKEPKEIEKVDATDAGNGSDQGSNSESSSESEEDSSDDVANEFGIKRFSIPSKKIRKLVSPEMIDHKEKLKNLPNLDSSSKTITKYRLVLDEIFDSFPTFKKIILDDFNIDSIKEVTMLLVCYNKASKILFYRYLADSIERILMSKTTSVFHNESGKPTLKEINQIIENNYNASEEIINYFKGFRKNRKVLKTSDRKRNIERFRSKTDRKIDSFFRRIDPRYSIEYYLFVECSSEANIKALGRELNEQYQAYRKDPSKGAASMSQTYSKMGADPDFTAPF